MPPDPAPALCNSIAIVFAAVVSVRSELALVPVLNNGPLVMMILPLFGVSQFNSTNFSVSGGFVNSQNFTINTSGALSGGGSITLGGTLNLSATSTPFPWTDQSTGFTAVSNNGYFVTASLTATLNSSPEQGDVIRFVVTASATLTIQANTGQKIRLGSVIGASAGSAVNTKQGDAMNLVYRTADTTWYNFESPVGAWTIS